MVADRWRASLAGLARPTPDGRGTVVVANADDPMVAYAAATAPEVHWVGAGQVWHDDAVGCPACGGRIVFAEDGRWACDRCDFARPAVAADGGRVRSGAGRRSPAAHPHRAAGPVQPGQRGHGGHGGRPDPRVDRPGRSIWRACRHALGRLDGITEVAGRFSTITRGGHPVRLLLAKNPAGWTAIFDLLDETGDARCHRGAVRQRQDGRRLRHQLAVGRPLRASGRADGGGDGGPSARPGRSAPLRRCRTRRGRRSGRRARPRRHGLARGDGDRVPRPTTRPSPTSGAAL